MQTIKRDNVGYTILVLDKYILCGTNRNSYFKDITTLGNNIVRQYKSIKVLMNNVPHHLSYCYGPEFHEFNQVLDEALIKANFISGNSFTWWNAPHADYYKKGAIKYLIDKKLIKIIKISQILSLEEIYE